MNIQRDGVESDFQSLSSPTGMQTVAMVQRVGGTTLKPRGVYAAEKVELDYGLAPPIHASVT